LFGLTRFQFDTRTALTYSDSKFEAVAAEVIMRVLFLCSWLAMAALAQQASITSLVGRVTDANGTAIPNASVNAANGATGESYPARTNVEGLYSLQSVRIGTYTITATAPGFGTLAHDNVLVQVNQVVRTDFELPVGQVTERVTVQAAPPPIATDDAGVSETLDTKAVTEVPLNGRDVLREAALTPGVIAGFKSRTGSSSSGGEDFIGVLTWSRRRPCGHRWTRWKSFRFKLAPIRRNTEQCWASI
jgi:hypothetical protein